ncbi:deoxynucleotidyltransferase terminal-interacting protein 1-like [Sarcoptes scabiei]|nr:deoxynucleotidyltransferase terminal-interacting protein 1-like [Sarcoptes scabiei]
MTIKRSIDNDLDDLSDQEFSVSKRMRFASKQQPSTTNAVLSSTNPIRPLAIQNIRSIAQLRYPSSDIDEVRISTSRKCSTCLSHCTMTILNTCGFCEREICQECELFCRGCQTLYCGLCAIKIYDFDKEYENHCNNLGQCFTCR